MATSCAPWSTSTRATVKAMGGPKMKRTAFLLALSFTLGLVSTSASASVNCDGMTVSVIEQHGKITFDPSTCSVSGQGSITLAVDAAGATSVEIHNSTVTAGAILTPAGRLFAGRSTTADQVLASLGLPAVLTFSGAIDVHFFAVVAVSITVSGTISPMQFLGDVFLNADGTWTILHSENLTFVGNLSGTALDTLTIVVDPFTGNGIVTGVFAFSGAIGNATIGSRSGTATLQVAGIVTAWTLSGSWSITAASGGLAGTTGSGTWSLGWGAFGGYTGSVTFP